MRLDRHRAQAEACFKAFENTHSIFLGFIRNIAAIMGKVQHYRNTELLKHTYTQICRN